MATFPRGMPSSCVPRPATVSARIDTTPGDPAAKLRVVVTAAVVTASGRIDADTVDFILGALEFIRLRNPFITADLSDVASISDEAVKTLFVYQVEIGTQGGGLTIVAPLRLRRRLAVCHTVPASRD